MTERSDRPLPVETSKEWATSPSHTHSISHADHSHIEVRDGAGIVKDKFLHREPYHPVTHSECNWCGFKPVDKVVADHPELGIAYFPYDDCYHCIMPEHCRKRLLIRIRLLLGAVKLVKIDRGEALLSALFPD
jgi:hypothetical protein